MGRDAMKKRFTNDTSKGIFLGETRMEKSRVAFDGGNMSKQAQKKPVPLLARLFKKNKKEMNGSYYTFYSGTSYLAVDGSDVTLDTLTGLDVPDNGKFQATEYSRSQPEFKSPESAIGRECTDCSLFINEGTHEYLVLELQGHEHTPVLTAKTLGEISQLEDSKVEIYYFLSVYFSTTDKNSNVAVYFPGSHKNYYLKPDGDECKVVVADRRENDETLSAHYLWFSTVYDNHGNE